MSYVKFSAPVTPLALDRARLFNELDARRREFPVVWISSPAGSGKTTLVNTYLAANASPAIWFQFDEGDGDPPTFFHYLARSLGDTGAALPANVPDEPGELVRFARRFFREYFACMAAGTVIVFDNVHDFDWQRHADLMEIAFAEISPELNLLALSRIGPPARLSRLCLNGQMTTMDWNDLKFTQDEACAVAGISSPPDPSNLAWIKRVDGWATGICVLRGQEGDGTRPAGGFNEDREMILARYFSGEILDRLKADEQECLLMLSSLPTINVGDAERLTGNPRASRMLRNFYDNHLFIARDSGNSDTYTILPLFREYLESEIHYRFTPEQRNALQQRSAAMLDDKGMMDYAALRYREVGAYSSLASMLIKRAPDMLAQGKSAKWQEWLGWLPPTMQDADPWLMYWLGNLQLPGDPAIARQALARAAQTFASLGDVTAQLLTCSAIIESYYFGARDYSGLHAPIATMLECLARCDLNSLDVELDLQIHSRLAMALALVTPDSPHLSPCVQRTIRALSLAKTPYVRLSAGAAVLNGMAYLDTDISRWVVTELGALSEHAQISPFMRAWWYARAALWNLYLEGNLSEAQRLNECGAKLVDVHGLERLRFQFKYLQVVIGLALNELDTASLALKEFKNMLSPSRAVDGARFALLETAFLVQSGEARTDLEALAQLVTQSQDARGPRAELAMSYRLMANFYAQAHAFEQADQWYGKAGELTYCHDQQGIFNTRELVRGYAMAVSGRQKDAMPILQSALSWHRQSGRSAFFVRFPLLASRICAVALDADIEKDHVRAIVKLQNLKAPGPFSANWPWPVAVRTLGSLTMSLNGDLLAFSGKAQQRPLVLLKALLIAPETGQSLQTIADHLWPDVADARASLNVTIHRLRKLLGNDDAVLVSAGKVSINRALVWSDVDALTNLCDRIPALPADVSASELNHLAVTLLSLYRGPYSDGNDEAWLLSGRNRWRNRFLEGATALGLQLEKCNALAMANTLYLRALEVEPLAETMYRNLMRCAHAQNDPSAAFSAYRRCRETLSVILGKRPSPETEKLAMSIGLIEGTG